MGLNMVLFVTTLFVQAFYSATTPPPYRLLGKVIPHHYTLSIFSNLDEFKFDGYVDIETECKQATDTIKLHSKDLTIDEDNVFVQKDLEGDKKKANKILYEKDYDYLVLKLDSKCEVGSKYLLHIPFKGEISESLSGFYRSSYVDEETKTTKWLASTQFEPTYARRAFPCFDEPAMKANFTVKLGHKPSLKALSNMPIANSYTKDGIVWDEFRQSVPMSTYLVAYIISEFDYRESEKESNNVEFRVYAQHGSLDSVEFARKYGPKFLKYYEDFFGIPYPLPKQDLVAIPDFKEGAMENWGLITFRESQMLLNPKDHSQCTMDDVAVTISHELAHQWFGNLVTMKWWTDLWLNEGFASYMSALAVKEQFPTWDSYNVDITGVFISVFELDALKSSHPVRPEDADPDTVFQYFDTISYDKGSLLLHMMHSFLGEDIFRKGVSDYLKLMKYQNAEQDDLWASLTKAAEGTEVLPPGVDVKAVMDTWTRQTGYPVLTVKREGGTITISQKRFLSVESESGEQPKECWWVPLTFSTAKKIDFENTQTSRWLSCKDKEFKIDTEADADDWIVLNNKLSALYRVDYDDEAWKQLAETLHCDEASNIHAMNRFQLVADAMDLASVGQLDYTLAFRVLSYIKKEREYIPWRAVGTALDGLDKLLYRTDNLDEFKKVINKLFTDIYNYETFSDLTTIPEEYAPARHKRMVVVWACRGEVGQSVQDSIRLFKEWMTTGKNRVANDLRQSAYCEAIKHGGAEEWNFLWEQYQKSTDPDEKPRLMDVLACTTQEDLLKRLLEYSLDRTKVKTQDAGFAFSSVVYYSKLGYDTALQFLQKDFKRLYDYYNPDTDSLGYYFKLILERIVYQEELDNMKKFISENQSSLSLIKLTLNQGLEKAERNVKWMNTYKDDISKALQSVLAES